jgi:polysaccharide export outer membrane protein
MKTQHKPPRNRLLAGLTALTVPLLLGGCQQTASRVATPAAAGPPAAAAYAANDTRSNTVAATTEPGREYRISPQDMLEVSVYQVPSLNRSVQVDGSGQIFFPPLAGGVQAGGRTVRELESDITAKLGAKYIKSPQVTVFVKEALGQRVIVDGAVRKPGLYSAKSLMQALTQAGGVDDIGDRDSVTVFRVADQQRTGQTYSLNSIRKGQAADPPIYGGDTIVVGESSARVLWGAVKDVAGAARMVPGL